MSQLVAAMIATAMTKFLGLAGIRRSTQAHGTRSSDSGWAFSSRKTRSLTGGAGAASRGGGSPSRPATVAATASVAIAVADSQLSTGRAANVSPQLVQRTRAPACCSSTWHRLRHLVQLTRIIGLLPALLLHRNRGLTGLTPFRTAGLLLLQLNVDHAVACLNFRDNRRRLAAAILVRNGHVLLRERVV